MLAPFIQSRIRVIRLRRKGNAPLGFSIRGGCEHGTGVFISEVQPSSEAQRQGLRVGDQILRINGFNIDHAIHEEVLSLLKAKPGVVLKVKSVGMIPVKDKKKDPLTWKVVDGTGGGGHSPADSIVDGTNSYSGSSTYDEYQEVQVTLNIIGASGIGCSIANGPTETPGIFVKIVKPGSLAECGGLQVGDQIIEMNGTSFLEIEFNQAVSLMKDSRELRLCLRKAAGLDLFPEEKKRRAAAMLNGTSHTTRDERRHLPILNEEEERHQNGTTNGVIIAEIITHPCPPPPILPPNLEKSEEEEEEDQIEGSHHQRQLSAATTATVSERDVSLSETNVPFALDPSSASSDVSTPPSTPSPVSTVNGDILEGPEDIQPLQKRPLEEVNLRREEERLAEERRRLEIEQARLKEEAEKLAQERRELEEERRQRVEGPPFMAVPVPPPPTPPLNFLKELQSKQLTPTLAGADRAARVRPVSMDGTKYQEEIVKRKQHEKLMQEFQKMHKKMFGATGEEVKPPPPIVEFKAPEAKPDVFAFSRRQQVSATPAPPPPASSVPRAVSQPNLRQGDVDEEDTTDRRRTITDSKTDAGGDPAQSTSGNGTENKRASLVPSKPVLIGSNTIGVTATNSTSIPQAGAKISGSAPTANGHVNSVQLALGQQQQQQQNQQQLQPQFPSLTMVSGSPLPDRKSSKDVPITDSRGPAPRPPQTYFETKPQKGPLVTIGVYPDNSRQNRFSNLSSNEGVRNRQSQFESRSSSPSSIAPISVSMTSSSASSSAASSPHPPERKVGNGQANTGGGNTNNPPVSFKVTYNSNSKTNGSVNSIIVNKSATETPPKLTVSLNGKSTSAKPTPANTNSTLKKPITVVKDPKELLSPEDIAGREIKVLTIPKTGPLNMKVSGGSGQPESGGRILVSELWEGGCIGPKVDLKKGDQIMMVGEKSLVNITLTLANVILKDAMSSTKDPLKLVVAREKE